MANRIVWTEDRLNEASRLWGQGVPASKIAEIVGVTKGSMSGTASMHRDLFPARPWAKEPAIAVVDHPTVNEPIQPSTRNRVHTLGIRSVERQHWSGEVHSLPRVSILNGKEA